MSTRWKRAIFTLAAAGTAAAASVWYAGVFDRSAAWRPRGERTVRMPPLRRFRAAVRNPGNQDTVLSTTPLTAAIAVTEALQDRIEDAAVRAGTATIRQVAWRPPSGERKDQGPVGNGVATSSPFRLPAVDAATRLGR